MSLSKLLPLLLLLPLALAARPSRPTSRQPSFVCPQDLIPLFDCTCYFSSLNRLPLQPFEAPSCRRRTRQLKRQPRKRRRVVRRCNIYAANSASLNTTTLAERRDAVFARCPVVRRKLCPFDPDYDVLRCVCFLVQTDRVKGDKANCDRDFGKLNRRVRMRLRKRCGRLVNFRLFAGSFVGLTARYCAQGFKQCCRALPDGLPVPPA